MMRNDAKKEPARSADVADKRLAGLRDALARNQKKNANRKKNEKKSETTRFGQGRCVEMDRQNKLASQSAFLVVPILYGASLC